MEREERVCRVSGGVVDGECLAVQVGSLVSCRVMLIGDGGYLVRWRGMTAGISWIGG